MTEVLEFDISEPVRLFHEFLMRSRQIENLVQYECVFSIEEYDVIFSI